MLSESSLGLLVTITQKPIVFLLFDSTMSHLLDIVIWLEIADDKQCLGFMLHCCHCLLVMLHDLDYHAKPNH